MNFVEVVLRGFLTPLAVGATFIAPLFVVGFLLHRQKRAYRAAADEPFIQLPLRPPGESLRLRIEELREEFDSHIYTMGIVGVSCLMVTITMPERTRLIVGTGMLAVALITTLWSARKLSRLVRLLWDYRLGFTGERLVGEELNQLLASGFRVFHDVPFEKYNIDHVLVGPPGVYVVETKSWRKPSDIKGPERASVTFDGSTLFLPKGKTDTKAIEQARRNARSLEAWLTKACGEQVTAKAILTLPGWFVTRRATSDVNVLNPDEIKHSFPSRIKSPLSSEQIQRISYQLTERCRLAKSA